jgi:hypothetical protein
VEGDSISLSSNLQFLQTHFFSENPQFQTLILKIRVLCGSRSEFVKYRFIGLFRFEIGIQTLSFIFLGYGFIGFLFMEAPFFLVILCCWIILGFVMNFWVCAMNFWVLLWTRDWLLLFWLILLGFVMEKQDEVERDDELESNWFWKTKRWTDFDFGGVVMMMLREMMKFVCSSVPNPFLLLFFLNFF